MIPAAGRGMSLLYEGRCLKMIFTVLAVFRARSQTLDFVFRLQRCGIPVQTVNTPKEAGVGCGLSAKFSSAALPQAKSLVRGGRYSSFVRFFAVQDRCGRTAFLPI